MLSFELSFKVTLYSKLSRRWRPLVTFSPTTLIQKNKIGEIEMLLPLLQIEQNFKKESLLQIATEFHLLSPNMN
jgi:hypothetical protein